MGYGDDLLSDRFNPATAAALFDGIFDGTVQAETVTVVSAAGSSQGDATAITKKMNKVDDADGTKGVKLPTAAAGNHVYVMNNHATSSLLVYPNTSDIIDQEATNDPIRIFGGFGSMLFVAFDDARWHSFIAKEAYPQGTYTPTLTNTANIDSSTAFTTAYKRDGDMVDVFGKVNIDTTSGGGTTTTLGMSLPLSSSFSNDYELSGTANGRTSSQYHLPVFFADTSNNRATMEFRAQGTGNVAYHFHFSYMLL